jgi:hypothetical protein
MALTPIQIVRLNVQDNTPGLYIISDDEVTYLLDKNSQNTNKASLDAARIILMNLSMRGDRTVDILSIKGSAAANAYRLALEMYLKDPNLNPVLNNCGAYAGGISISDMVANVANTDNNSVLVPTDVTGIPLVQSPIDYFKF